MSSGDQHGHRITGRRAGQVDTSFRCMCNVAGGLVRVECLRLRLHSSLSSNVQFIVVNNKIRTIVFMVIKSEPRTGR